MTTLIIARHGNNFDPGEEALRIGAKTDLPLSSSGRQQAKNIGYYLKQHKIKPTVIFCSELQRTQQTAALAMQTANIDLQPIVESQFNEIDYGPDEGKTTEQVIARIGNKALEDWENMAIVPNGWLTNVDNIIDNWRNFAQNILNKYPTDIVMVITSNGIARFAPYLTNDFLNFSQTHKIKLATGALAALTFNVGAWHIDYWNEKPMNIASDYADDEPIEYGNDDSSVN